MAKKNFEESLRKLEEITDELENGELGLEQSLKKFNEGIKLVEFCHQTLDKAQQQVDILLKKDGQLVRTPFSEDSAGS